MSDVKLEKMERDYSHDVDVAIQESKELLKVERVRRRLGVITLF